MNDYHIPVLLKESINGLNIVPDGIYVDATFGGGGHSSEILKYLTHGRLYAFDQDEDASENQPEDKRFFFIQGNFRFIKNFLKYEGVEQIDGLIADLGVSSHQFDTSERGFTYRSDALLDMRMNRQGGITAGTIINDYEEDRLFRLFKEYGELNNARKLANVIVHEREKQRINSAFQLISCLRPLAPKQAENQFFSKVFQALRIEVNHEIESLKDMLSGAACLLKPGGRLAVISYHSLEDRLVKNFMRWGHFTEEPVKDIYGNRPELFRLVTRKPVVAGDKELKDNPRARSAHLRIGEKIN